MKLLYLPTAEYVYIVKRNENPINQNTLYDMDRPNIYGAFIGTQFFENTKQKEFSELLDTSEEAIKHLLEEPRFKLQLLIDIRKIYPNNIIQEFNAFEFELVE